MNNDSATTVDETKRSFPQRLWIYQGERFPLISHGVLIAAFSTSAVCVSALLRGETTFPAPRAFIVAFGVLLALFFLLRVADEHKDAEDDAAYRPERAVPRGLVTLKELTMVGALVALIQAGLAFSLHWGLLTLLAIVWVYFYLMTVEFFVGEWLRKHMLWYMASHMLIMPLVDLFATACDWLVVDGAPPPGLFAFLAVSFFNGVVIEVGRKTWAPKMERKGVESYSSSWGMTRAINVWLGAIIGGFVCASIVARAIHFWFPAMIVLAMVGCAAMFVALKYHNNPTPQSAKLIEHISGIWVLTLYLILGLVPMSVAVWG